MILVYIPQVDSGVKVCVSFRISEGPSIKSFELKPEPLA
jgi:hypothetical protein